MKATTRRSTSCTSSGPPCATTASSHGVRVAKWLGDGAMLVGIETEPLVEAVVEIEERISRSGSPLPLRAGICAGPVILFEGDDYIGHAVNIAARLCDEAAPREVLAPADTVSALLVNTDAVPAGDRVIRGLDEPVAIVRLTAWSDRARVDRAEWTDFERAVGDVLDRLGPVTS